MDPGAGVASRIVFVPLGVSIIGSSVIVSVTVGITASGAETISLAGVQVESRMDSTMATSEPTDA